MLSVATQLFVIRQLQQTGFISRCPVLVLVVFRFLWWTELMEWKHLTCAVFTCLDFSRISLRCKPDASGLSILEWNLLILLNSDSLSLKYRTVFKLIFFFKSNDNFAHLLYFDYGDCFIIYFMFFFSDTNGTTGYFVMYRIKYIRKLKVIKTDHNWFYSCFALS